MFVTTVIVSILLALMLTMSAWGKLTRQPRMTEGILNVGVKENQLPLLASAELAGAVGLIAGLFWWPVGVAAGIGVLVYFVGAMTAHLRIGDRNLSGAAIMLLMASIALTVRLASI